MIPGFFQLLPFLLATHKWGGSPLDAGLGFPSLSHAFLFLRVGGTVQFFFPSRRKTRSLLSFCCREGESIGGEIFSVWKTLVDPSPLFAPLRPRGLAR